MELRFVQHIAMQLRDWGPWMRRRMGVVYGKVDQLKNVLPYTSAIYSYLSLLLYCRGLNALGQYPWGSAYSFLLYISRIGRPDERWHDLFHILNATRKRTRIWQIPPFAVKSAPNLGAFFSNWQQSRSQITRDTRSSIFSCGVKSM